MCLGNTKPSAFNLLAKYPTHHGWFPESLCLKDNKSSRAVSLHLLYGVFHSRLPLILKGKRGVMTLHWSGREYRVSRPSRIVPQPPLDLVLAREYRSAAKSTLPGLTPSNSLPNSVIQRRDSFKSLLWDLTCLKGSLSPEADA
ncbi:hypothetical protein L204_102273 [Cryptococcus depauperatus]